MSDIKKVKAVSLILDWNLWPRHESGDLDSTNLKRMKVALTANIELPPVIADKKSLRIIDGFHRVTAYLSVFGDDADIMADFRQYKNDAEMFVDSARFNSAHGLPLSPKDRAHTILKARKFKIPMPIIAEAIGMSKEQAKAFLEKRTAKTQNGESIPLPGGALSLAGKTLTKTQQEKIKGINGMKAASNAKILLNELDVGAFIINDNFIKTLTQLKEKIDKILQEVGE